MSYKKINKNEALAAFDEMLDESYPSFKIGQLEYFPSQILKECDPIAYRCEFNDWLDAEQLEIGEPDNNEQEETEEEDD